MNATFFKHRLRLQLAMGENLPSPNLPSPTRVNIPGMDWLRQADPEKASFVRMISERPEDDAPKLVMADWLDERGDSTTAARLRWFVQASRSFDPDTLYNLGAKLTRAQGWNPEGKQNWAVGKLLDEHGFDAVNAYNVLVRHALHKINPIDWNAVNNLGYMTTNTEKLRQNIEGVHVANELMALGVIPPEYNRTIERQAQTNLNDVNMMAPVATRGRPQEHVHGHVIYLHTHAHAGSVQAYAMNEYGGRDEILRNSHFITRLHNRTAVNSALAKHTDEGTMQADAHQRYSDYHNTVMAGLALHPFWKSFPKELGMGPHPETTETKVEPEPEAPAGTHRPEHRVLFAQFIQRFALKLAQPEHSELPIAESFTAPERQWVEQAPKSVHKGPGQDYSAHLKQLFAPKAKPFTSTIPHVQTLTTLAELGEPVKGEYEATAHAIKSLFGHDHDGVAAWMGLNGVFSPQTSYKDHAGAAAMLTAAWLEAKKPKDETSIRSLIEAVDTFGKHYAPDIVAGDRWDLNPETGKYVGILPGSGDAFGGTMRVPMNIQGAVRVLQNVEKLRAALEDPTGQAGQDLELLGGRGMSKVPNFVLSYVHPTLGTALDVHMSRLLLHPDLDSFKHHSDILRQVRAHLPRSNQDQMDRLEKKSLAGLPIRSELVRLLMKNPYLKVKTGRGGKYANLTVSDWLKDINGRLLSFPQHYLAFKFAINEAAKKLGWTPAQVQESVWTSVIGLMAANSAGISGKEIQQHLTADVLRKGWNNHEAIYYPKLVDALRRGGANPQTLRRVGKRLSDRAAEASRPGIVRVSRPADLPVIAAHLPGVTARHAGRPILDAIRKRMTEYGLLSKDHQAFQAARPGEPLQLMAQYDRPLDFNLSLDRIQAANQEPLIQALKNVLMQSGIVPRHVAPAVHDYAGQTRASILALGLYANQEAAKTGTAWVGLLGRQPGMLSFQGNPQGKDSIYTFHHHDAAIVRNVLQEAGIPNRTIVPHGKHYQVYIYDPQHSLRGKVAKALGQLRATATEWRGDGKPLGGETEDMGRAQYRSVINRGEAQQFARQRCYNFIQRLKMTLAKR